MNSFNDLQYPKQDKEKNMEFQDSQPNRARKPLSKFTISSSNPLPDRVTPIPAYRTHAQESLPILSPQDLKRMNISRFTGMSLYDYHSPPNTSANASTSRTKQSRLQRKTIHRSLEDLRNTKNNFDHTSSSDSRISVPSKDSETVPSPPSRNENRYTNGSASSTKLSNCALANPIPDPAIKSQNDQQQSRNFDSSTNTNAINTGPTNGTSSSKEDDEGERSVPIPTAEKALPLNNINEQKIGKEENEHFHNLSLENDSLKKQIGNEKREYIMFRVTTELISRTLKRKSLQLIEMEHILQTKRIECAARVVLHHLLLNSWRMTKAQVGVVTLENTQMHKTIDNQSLQLNIIRKMQSMEKEKTSTILKEYAEVKRKYCQVMKENEGIKEGYAKVLEEKTALERHLRSLSDENSRLKADLRVRLDKREMQLKSMELDKLQSDKFSRENEQLSKETELAKNQIKELVIQRVQWQEKAMYLESKCFELELEMDGKAKVYEKVLHEKHEMSKENEHLSLSKSNLEKAVEESQTKLVESTEEKNKWESSYQQCRAELEDLQYQMEYLQTALHQHRKDNKEMREKLERCTKVRNRKWGAAFYYFLHPFETFKRFYFGTPGRLR